MPRTRRKSPAPEEFESLDLSRHHVPNHQSLGANSSKQLRFPNQSPLCVAHVEPVVPPVVEVVEVVDEAGVAQLPLRRLAKTNPMRR